MPERISFCNCESVIYRWSRGERLTLGFDGGERVRTYSARRLATTPLRESLAGRLYAPQVETAQWSDAHGVGPSSFDSPATATPSSRKRERTHVLPTFRPIRRPAGASNNYRGQYLFAGPSFGLVIRSNQHADRCIPWITSLPIIFSNFIQTTLRTNKNLIGFFFFVDLIEYLFEYPL